MRHTAIMPSSLPLTRLFAFFEKRSVVMGAWCFIRDPTSKRFRML